jgi:hypothetical protein
MESKAFFKVPGTALPVGNAVDPRIYYDHFQNRWVASATDLSSHHVILAVSNTDDGNPTDLDGNWTKHDVPLTMPLAPHMDFPTLGLDANGIYISVARIGEGAHDVVAIKKPNIYQGSLVATVLPKVQQSELDTETIQPAFNFDNPPLGGFAWFLAKSRPVGGLGGRISYRRLQWNGTTAQWAGDWGQLAGSSYTSYFDLDGSTVSAPQPIVSHRINLGGALNGGDRSRLSASVIRNNTLWTCHSVGLDGANQDYDGGTVDRTAIQWIKMNISDTGDPLSYSGHGRIYDNSLTQPRWYYFPSMSVNKNGDVVFAFAASTESETLSAYFSWRRSDGT